MLHKSLSLHDSIKQIGLKLRQLPFFECHNGPLNFGNVNFAIRLYKMCKCMYAWKSRVQRPRVWLLENLEVCVEEVR